MFQNEYTMNRKLIKEYVYQVLSKKIIIPGIIVFILGIVLFVVRTNDLGYLMLTSSFVVLFCIIFSPIIMINNFESVSKRINNGTIEKTHVIFNENIVMDEGKAHLEFEYSQIKGIVQTKNFIVLKLGKESAILVHKDGFVNGTYGEFLIFIQDKIKKN